MPFVMCLWIEPLLYDDYARLNTGKDETIKTKDAKFYFNLGRAMYDAGYKSFDHVTVNEYTNDKPELRTKFLELKGYKNVEDMRKLVNPDNVEGYFDKIVKLNLLSDLCGSFFDSFSDVSKFDDRSSADVYDYFDLELNKISISTAKDMKVEDVYCDNSFISELNKGTSQGLPYGKNCPRMNYATLGIPKGDLTMFGGFSGTGKTSFVFENLILPMAESGIKCCIISNEMQIQAYKQLQLVHVLTHDLNYWKLTRKRLKTGNFSQEQNEILVKAAEITQQKYKGNIKFVKMFDNDTARVCKTIRKYSKLDFQLFLWDTMKSDDDSNMEMYRQLLQASRKVFQTASRENVAVVCTYQLALYAKDKRFLDATCLSNSKQIKEVFSEMLYMRPLWEDEYTGERYDCRAYTRGKNADGSWEKFTTPITLDKTKKYIVAFLDKTRNDEDNQQFLYEVDFTWNRWREIGYCKIRDDHIALAR